MNIRQAILAAANSIKKNPEMFDFQSVLIPDCNTPGCALGWIGHHLGMTRNKNFLHDVSDAIGLTHSPSFLKLDEVYGSCRWRDTAPECAKALRLYADKYHPAPQESVIPESILSLFKERVHVN